MRESYQPTIDTSEPEPTQEKKPKPEKSPAQNEADFIRVKEIGGNIMMAAADGNEEASQALDEIFEFAQKFQNAFSKDHEFETYKLYHALIVSTPKPELTKYDVGDEYDQNLSVLRKANELAQKYKFALGEKP